MAPADALSMLNEYFSAASNLLHMMSSRQFAGQMLRLRIGISTVPVVAGSVGGANRMFYTVHGDAVNTAARLEELNKAHGTRLLVAETTRRLAKSMSGWRKASEETLRGHSRAVSIYSIN